MSELPVVKTRRKGKHLTQSMLIPTEKMVADELRAARPGHLSDLAELRRKLAVKYGADACCPVDVAPSFYPVLSSFPAWVVPCWAGEATGAGAEPLAQSSASDRRGLKVLANSAGVCQAIWECGRRGVVVGVPQGDGDARLSQRGKQRLVEQFIAQSAVEALDEAIIRHDVLGAIVCSVRQVR